MNPHHFDGEAYSYHPGVANTTNCGSTPDSASLSITGSFSIAVRVALDVWTPAAVNSLMGKVGAAGNRSWYFAILDTSFSSAVYLGRWADGTTEIRAISSASPVVSNGGWLWLLGTVNTTTGKVNFYTAPDCASIPTSWTSLGNELSTAAGNIYVSTAGIQIGLNETSVFPLSGKVKRGLLYSGVVLADGTGGIVVSDYNPSLAPKAFASGATWTAASGEVWTLNKCVKVLCAQYEGRSFAKAGSTKPNGKDVFCMAPWVHLQVLPDARVFPCCMGDQEYPVGDLNKSTIAEIWNGENMRALRKRMLTGTASPECRRCYEIENSGKSDRNDRTALNSRFWHHVEFANSTREDGSLERVNLPFLDIRFSNLCNFRCRSCGPLLSSGWYKDSKEFFNFSNHPKVMTPTDNPDDLMGQLEPFFDDLEEIYFGGGEPLLMDEHYWILNLLIKKKRHDVRIIYNTNFSKIDYKGKSVLKLWNEFESVNVGASLDGMGARGEYLRKGQDWELIEANRRRMIADCPRAKMEIAYTLGLMNSLHLPDFHRNWVERGLIDADRFHINLLSGPQYLCLQLLPPHIKAHVREKYLTHVEKFLAPYGDITRSSSEEYLAAIEFMEKKDQSNLLPEFRRKTKKLDQIRGEEFESTFPELAELFA